MYDQAVRAKVHVVKQSEVLQYYWLANSLFCARLVRHGHPHQ